MSSPQEDAKVMIEVIEHPERFCPICYKRVGVCNHTRTRQEIE